MQKIILKRNIRGQGMTEYIVIVALIAVAAIAIYQLFSATIRNQTAGMAMEGADKDGSAAIAQAGTAATKATTGAKDRRRARFRRLATRPQQANNNYDVSPRLPSQRRSVYLHTSLLISNWKACPQMYVTSWSFYAARSMHRQRGQALIYGLFVLTAGLAAQFFLFNTGQLTAEKTKLVNPADAVAYSAGIMHARALNFDAYTNRALMANEVMIAQAVSFVSGTKHVVRHTENVPPLTCLTSYSRPVVLVLVTYIPAFYLLSFPAAKTTAQVTDAAVSSASGITVGLSEAAKVALQSGQPTMSATFLKARSDVMQQVADANYVGDGSVQVETSPLSDDFPGFIRPYSGNDRTRFKGVAVESANKDDFIKERSWTSANIFPCILGNKAAFRRRGGTELIGFDEWKAMDAASLNGIGISPPLVFTDAKKTK